MVWRTPGTILPISTSITIHTANELDFGHSFVKSSDPARLLTDNIFVMPRDNFRENATALTVTHDSFLAHSLEFRFDNTFTKISSVIVRDNISSESVRSGWNCRPVAATG